MTYGWKDGAQHLTIGDDARALLRNKGWELDGEPERTANTFDDKLGNRKHSFQAK